MAERFEPNDRITRTPAHTPDHWPLTLSLWVVFQIGLSLGGVTGARADEAGENALCRYRPNLEILNNSSKATYTDIRETGFKYAFILLNDYSYYMGGPVACPNDFEGRCEQSDRLLVAWQERLHAVRPAEAVILLHGNSAIPDNFLDGSRYYLNSAGTRLFTDGMDVYAPYVTHDSRFQNARRRLASLQGDGFKDLDVRRVLDLYARVSASYSTVHVAGVSYGGQLAVLATQALRDSSADRTLGMVLSIEGFAPVRNEVVRHPRFALFGWNWEMVFPGTSEAQFAASVAALDVYLAAGSCNLAMYDYSGTPPERVLHYRGGHQFSLESFYEALERFRAAHRDSAAP